jgi:K+-transporting ATPase c subunit
MENHKADDQYNQDDINIFDNIGPSSPHAIPGDIVNGSSSHLFGDSGVTLTAGILKVGRINCRRGIGTGEYSMDTMARSTVGDMEIPCFTL